MEKFTINDQGLLASEFVYGGGTVFCGSNLKTIMESNTFDNQGLMASMCRSGRRGAVSGDDCIVEIQKPKMETNTLINQGLLASNESVDGYKKSYGKPVGFMNRRDRKLFQKQQEEDAGVFFKQNLGASIGVKLPIELVFKRQAHYVEKVFLREEKAIPAYHIKDNKVSFVAPKVNLNSRPRVNRKIPLKPIFDFRDEKRVDKLSVKASCDLFDMDVVCSNDARDVYGEDLNLCNCDNLKYTMPIVEEADSEDDDEHWCSFVPMSKVEDFVVDIVEKMPSFEYKKFLVSKPKTRSKKGSTVSIDEANTCQVGGERLVTIGSVQGGVASKGADFQLPSVVSEIRVENLGCGPSIMDRLKAVPRQVGGSIVDSMREPVIGAVDQLVSVLMADFASVIATYALDSAMIAANIAALLMTPLDRFGSLALGVANVLYPLVRLMYSGHGNTTQGWFDMKTFSHFNTFVKALDNARDLSKTAFELVPEYFQRIMEWVVPVVWRRDAEYRRLLRQIANWEMISNSGQIVKEIDELDLTIVDEIINSPHSRYHSAAHLILKRVSEIKSRNAILESTGRDKRPVPFSVIHMGGSQVGKSTLNELELMVLQKVKKSQMKMYRRNNHDSYWSGYDPTIHKVVSFDEFGQDTTSNTDALEYIGLVSTAMYLPPMPALTDPTGKVGIKGVAAEPLVVLVNTNVTNIHTLCVASPDAIIKRTNMLVTVERNQDLSGLEAMWLSYEFEGVAKKRVLIDEYLRDFVVALKKHEVKQAMIMDIKPSNSLMDSLDDLYNETQSGSEIYGMVLGASAMVTVVGGLIKALSSLYMYFAKPTLLMELIMYVEDTERVLSPEGFVLYSHLVTTGFDFLTYAYVTGDDKAVKYLIDNKDKFVKCQSFDDKKGRKKPKIYNDNVQQGGSSSASMDYSLAVSQSMMIIDKVRGERDENGRTVLTTTGLNAFHWRDGYYVCPKHLFAGESFPLKVLLRDPTAGEDNKGFVGKQIVILKKEDVRMHDSADIAVVDLHECKFPIKRRLNKKFVVEENLAYIPKESPCSLVGYSTLGKTDASSKPVYTVRYVDATLNMDRHEVYSGANEHYFMVRSATYKSNTVVGDCGSLLILEDQARGSRIFGMHVFGNPSGRGGSMVVTQELIESLMPVNVALVPDHLEVETSFAEDGERYVPVAPYTSRKTDIVRSVIPGEPKKFPSDKFGPPEPLRYAVDRFGDKSVCDPIVIDESEFVFPAGNARILTMDESCLAIEHLSQVNMNTSCGYPYSVEGLKKADLIEDGKPNFRLCSDVMSYRAKYEVCVPELLFIPCLKDETLRAGKVCRTIMVPPVWFTVLCRQYFGAFADMFHSRALPWSAVGINAESLEWHDMYSYLSVVSDKGFDGDTVNYDQGLLVRIMRNVGRRVNNWYRLNGCASDEDDKIRMNIIDSVAFSGFIIGKKVFFRCGGNRSGWFMTTIINTMALYEIMLELYYGSVEPKLRCHMYRSALYRFVLYGDDNISSVADELLHVVNRRTWSDYMGTLGWQVTGSDKDQLVLKPSDWLDKLTLLKRSFVDFNGFKWPAIELKTIDNMLFWTKKSKFSTDKEQLEVNSFLALRFAFFHGPSVYEHYHKLINDYVGRKFPSYWYWYNIFNDSATSGGFDLDSEWLDLAISCMD